MQNTPHRRKHHANERGESDDELIAQKFGDLVTADHIIIATESDYSRHGDTAVLGCQDLATKWIGGYPAPHKTAEETIKALQHFAGKEKVALLYSDGSGELEAAACALQIPHDISTPHRPQNNGVAEQIVRRIIEGARCCLLASGLAHVWWREALQAYCYLRNVHDLVRGNKTPYELRFKTAFFWESFAIRMCHTI